MPILTQDIKLLKSAVMADTTDGGGQMSGLEVIDGQSNNLFPDTSAMDRAFGRVNMRKVFGVAHTSDTDTFLGAHAIITAAPADPLVHCALLRTTGWADTRTAAREVIERYLVKGPELPARIYDTHYAGSLQLRLYSFVGAAFPAGGDAIVLRNPNGADQYVRILKTSVSSENVALTEGGSTAVLTATVATCDLGQALLVDVLGPPAYRSASASGIVEANFASAYSTSFAGGAKFYGIKKLGVAGTVGDTSVTTAGGIYTPIVPAATVETPIIDQYPLLGRAATAVTAVAAVTLPAVTAVLNPNRVITLPTAIEPNSLVLTHGSTVFTDTGEFLQQGTTKVADINYRTGAVTFLSTSPNYGSGSLVTQYKPSSVVGASTHSSEYTITTANQGLAFVSVVQPSPAPGSLSVSYMAQGRWYVLQDNLNGKLAGADPTYGTGSINYSTGSMAMTLGAIPDVGSPLIFDWGDTTSGSPLAGSLPARATAQLALPSKTLAAGITVTWSNGATNYTASTGSTGVLTGDATGMFRSGFVDFQPAVFPSGDISVNYNLAASIGTSVSNTATLTYLATAYTVDSGNPLRKGSVSAFVGTTFPANTVYPFTQLPAYDRDGGMYVMHHAGYGTDAVEYLVGTVNYDTGVIVFSESVTIRQYLRESRTATGGLSSYAYFANVLQDAAVTLTMGVNFSYAYGTTGAQSATFATPTWSLSVNTSNASLVLDSLVLTVGNALYTASAGTLRKDWSVLTGTAAVPSAGSVTTQGTVTLSSLPANNLNVATWYNVAVNAAANKVSSGVFRTASAPLKAGAFQIQSGALVGIGADTGVISGANFTGTVDYARGVVRWGGNSVAPESLSYNAVFLQYLPMDSSLLGLDTTRLPLDGKVPIFRQTDLVVVHNTLTYALPNPLIKTTVYNLGRERLASVRVKDTLGVVVPDTLYTTDLNAGTIVVPTPSDITSYSQPFAVEHRIEDMLLCSQADISGRLKFTRSLTHDFPANTSFVSSAMPFGDLFARVYNLIEQDTWTSVWSDTLIGSTILPQFNDTLYPIVVTNGGAIKERWALIFTNSGTFRVIGESVGEIATGTTVTECAPTNPATGVPYFAIPALGWGNGWAIGNVLRFNTDACGTPFWPIRTVLQGPASIDSDQFTIAFRGDVDRA